MPELIITSLLLGVGLAMDACAVSMANGLKEPTMKVRKVLLVAFFFGLFQGLMPLIGYIVGSSFLTKIEWIIPWLALVLLGFIGGKMMFEAIRDIRHPELKKSDDESKNYTHLTIGVLFVQAVATSIDAFAVGVNMACYESAGTLAMPVWLACIVIACITFLVCTIAVLVGKKTGDVFSDKATLAGGIILVIIAIKMLVEGIISLVV